MNSYVQLSCCVQKILAYLALALSDSSTMIPKPLEEGGVVYVLHLGLDILQSTLCILKVVGPRADHHLLHTEASLMRTERFFNLYV